MHAFLDDQPLPVAQPTLHAAVRAAVEKAAAAGRVIVEVHADGRRLPDELIVSPPDEAVGGELRFTSAHPRELVRTVLRDAAGALGNVLPIQRQCAEALQVGRQQDALAQLTEVIQTWQAIREALDSSVQLLGVPLERFSASAGGGPDLAALDTALIGRLKEIDRALRSQDWSALADVLAYDMGDEAERWQVLLTGAADRLESP